jgi:alcohol dehydrogenase class IV
MIPYEDDLDGNLDIRKVKKPGLPKIFVPTTRGTGSELSHIFFLFGDKDGEKITSYSPYCLGDVAGARRKTSPGLQPPCRSSF